VNRNNKVERIWKDVIGPNLRYCAGVYLEELRNKKVRIDYLWAKICTQNLCRLLHPQL
jgi:hypothetical protein